MVSRSSPRGPSQPPPSGWTSHADLLSFALADVQTLRIHHHICGVLSGTLPEMGQQNVFLGLPLILLPEEVVLLVRHSEHNSTPDQPRPQILTRTLTFPQSWPS